MQADHDSFIASLQTAREIVQQDVRGRSDTSDAEQSHPEDGDSLEMRRAVNRMRRRRGGRHRRSAQSVARGSLGQSPSRPHATHASDRPYSLRSEPKPPALFSDRPCSLGQTQAARLPMCL
ncbi:hypothetical protein CYMTET_7299 [Cymbomonas tetramitiformis]|uniref:Uncharacterized protein n=1 Tax=Cymbomonas tetramitiformis TaxID=36881 RepID=A0AAE0LHL1_9CHLO|nr:hypothetical protein CYMTET_7299 [Cymbomonas tetramitiformis]